MELIQSLAIVAFSAGILMFLAPCTFPLVPALLASLSTRLSFEEISKKKMRIELLLNASFFSLGFTIVFVIFGILASYIGSVVHVYKNIFAQVAGILMLVLGLSMLGVPVVQRYIQSISFVRSIAKGTGKSHALLLGSFFALGWAPCSGPILASILILASQTATLTEGGVLLFIFSLGVSVPFIITGFLYGHVLGIFKKVAQYTSRITKISGGILIVFGLILLTNKYVLLTSWGFALFSFFGYTPMCTYL